MNSDNNKKFLVIVDVQPNFQRNCHFILPEIVEKINLTSQDIICFFVGKVLEGDKELLAREVTLFDEFTKDDRTSYAFRLVIQSRAKTLTDEEANIVADKVYEYLKGKWYEVR